MSNIVFLLIEFSNNIFNTANLVSCTLNHSSVLQRTNPLGNDRAGDQETSVRQVSQGMNQTRMGFPQHLPNLFFKKKRDENELAVDVAYADSDLLIV
jgi:hypothetical protein